MSTRPSDAKPQLASQRSRPVVRCLLLASILATALDGANAVVIVGADQMWVSDTTLYGQWAATCRRANPSAAGCGAASGGDSNPNYLQGKVIMSWGALGTTTNSQTTWTNDLGYAFKVTGVTLLANGSVGTNPLAGQNTRNIPAGQGITGAWEVSSAGVDTDISNARVQLTNRYGFTGNTGEYAGSYAWPGSVLLSDGVAYANQLITYQPSTSTYPPPSLAPLDPNLGWIDAAGRTTQQTPINDPAPAIDPLDLVPGRYFAASTNVANNIIGSSASTGNQVAITLFESAIVGSGENPEAVLSSIKYNITYSMADLNGELNFGDVRTGTTTAAKGAAIWNKTDISGGFRALNVVAGGPTGSAADRFELVNASGQVINNVSLGTLNPTESVVGANTAATYTFAPHATDLGQLSANVRVTSTAPDGSTDAQTINFNIIGTGVAPEPKLVATLEGDNPADPPTPLPPDYFVFDYTGSAIIGKSLGFLDAGQPVAIGDTEIRKLALSNVFPRDLADKTDMTILDLVIEDDPGKVGDDASYFKLSLVNWPSVGDPVVAANAQTTVGPRLADALFNITFAPNDMLDPNRTYNAKLTFSTDVGVAKGAAGQSYTIFLTGQGYRSGGAAPLPGTLLLMGLGLTVLRFRRSS
jgi:hypothetical protein